MKCGVAGMSLKESELFACIDAAAGTGYDVIELEIGVIESCLGQGHTTETIAAKFTGACILPHVMPAILDIKIPEVPNTTDPSLLFIHYGNSGEFAYIANSTKRWD